MPTSAAITQAQAIEIPRLQPANPAAIYLARLAPSSRRTMGWALRVIAELLAGGPADPRAIDWSQVGYAHVVAVRALLGERYAPATANRMLSAFRGTLREAWRLEQIGAEAFYRAIDVPRIRGQAAPRGRALNEAELALLLEASLRDPTPRGARDAAIVTLLATSGLRRAELAALDLADYEPASAALVVREGKGRKGRITYAPAGIHALERWLGLRGQEPGPLFAPVTRGGRLAWRHLTGGGIWRILRERGLQAGLRAFSPHDLRRTWIGTLLDAGADLATVQLLAGHVDPRTTAGYDRRGEAAKRRAAGLLKAP